ncbi:hypothetical protein L8R98_00230 [Vibrio splendidus]|uniref:hypothetical protein n=1 Tax=Vibrio splendidus TaxID=29497 RepID=UPI00246950F6|nr:hypothetical protein [Vibrio splendidus]MDH5975195.1 hypothetical protein [Vibrio splendidus]
MNKWPSEIHQSINKNRSTQSFDYLSELNDLFSSCDFLEQIKCTVHQINNKETDLDTLKSSTLLLSEKLDLPQENEYQEIIITCACAIVLSLSPQLKVWSYLKDISYHSYIIENYLFDAMRLYSEKNENAKANFIKLSIDAFIALQNDKLESKINRHTKSRQNALSLWSSSQDKIKELWWGLRGFDFFLYKDEAPLFRLLYLLECESFCKLLSSTTNPYLVKSVLFSAGTSFCFKSWEEIIYKIESPFDEEDLWIELPVLPLMLNEAHQKIIESTNYLSRNEANEDDIIAFKDEVKSTIEYVISVIFKRDDAALLCTRWLAWLMREVLVQNNPDENDIFSTVCVNTLLIDEIGRSLLHNNFFTTSPDDAPLWEKWNYKAVLCRYLENGFIEDVNIDDFIEKWFVDIDNLEKIESSFQEIDSVMFSYNQDIPTSAYYLSYPISLDVSPKRKWNYLWSNLSDLREIVEFGCEASSDDDKYRYSTTANKMLWAAICLGIASLDHLKQKLEKSDSSNKSLIDLFRVLISAIEEMQEINYFIDGEKWDLAFKHLMMRRVIWECYESGNAIFSSIDSPTIMELFNKNRNNVVACWELINLMHANGIDIPEIHNLFDTSSNYLNEISSQMEYLNSIDSKRYPYEKELMEKLLSYKN